MRSVIGHRLSLIGWTVLGACTQEAQHRAPLPEIAPVISSAMAAAVADAPRIASAWVDAVRRPLLDDTLHRPACRHPRDLEYYFPVHTLVPDHEFEGADQLVRTWYSKVFARMDEPSLTCAQANEEVFRFTAIPTWRAPVTVRVTWSGQTGEVSTTVLNGQGGYDPGYPASVSQRPLKRTEVEEIRRALAAAEFWKLPTRRAEEAGFDGSQWIVEARRGDLYHVVDRWSPRAGAFYDLCRSFTRLSGVSPT